MKYTFCLSLFFFCSHLFCQTKTWESIEISDDLKLKLPAKTEAHLVRDLNVHTLDMGTYEWQIISLPIGTFLKDQSDINFLGQVKNISNELMRNPYVQFIKDSLFTLKGFPAYLTFSKHTDASDTSLNTSSCQLYMQIDQNAYISHLKYFRESKVTINDIDFFLSSIKTTKNEIEDSLKIVGEKSYFECKDKMKFLKSVYCNLPEIEKTKSYHKLLSLIVKFELTETGTVENVILERDKMVLITRETEERLNNYFSKFKFNKTPKTNDAHPKTFEFVLFLNDFPIKYYCH